MKSSSQLTVDLRKMKPFERNMIGNKAYNLSTLIKNGFNVPNGFVIKNAAYFDFIKLNNLEPHISKLISGLDNAITSDQEKIQELKQKFEEAQLPPDLIKEIKNHYADFATKHVAVRSSATMEDLFSASFAGQYDSFLNIKGFEDIFQHIKKCYASLWSTTAIAYRNTNNIPHNSGEIAVIVQELIFAEFSGVLFTLNPLNNDASEMIIESNFGLGESIMSGQCSPDQYVIKKGTVKNQKTYKIVEKVIGNKQIQVIPNYSETKSGTIYEKLHSQQNLCSSLDDDQIVNLAVLGELIENLFKKIPQDIEWAIDAKNVIFILQTRPITTMKSLYHPDNIVWSRGYSDDYWNDSVSPLFFDLLGDQLTKIVNVELNQIMGYKKIDDNLLKLKNGHVYFNLKVLRRKVEYEIPKFMRNEDILNYFPDGTGFYGKETIKNLPFHLLKRLLSEIRIMLYDPSGSMGKTHKLYQEWTTNEFLPYCRKFDTNLKNLQANPRLNRFYRLAQELDKTIIPHFRFVRYGIPVHNIGMNLLTQYLLNRFLGLDKTLQVFPILISGLEHKLTETNSRIQELVSTIKDSEELRNIFILHDPVQILGILHSKSNGPSRHFLIMLQDFLDEYGDRGFTREPYYPRWSEKPLVNLFDILKSLVSHHNEIGVSNKISSQKKRQLLEKWVEAKIRNQKLGFLKWLFLRTILKYARLYIVFRENQRFNLDKWITRNRHVYLEIGKILKDQGFISENFHVFFLNRKEIRKIVSNGVTTDSQDMIRTSIEQRYKEFATFENKVPPKFIRANREFNDQRAELGEDNSYKGIPASQGIATGNVRILNNIDEIDKVKSGELLVVSKTDPGWTPIFSKISGLITETGGILSHGAVVSREYGIPAVTNIANACQMFKDGQLVTINGFDGKVIIH